MAGPGFTQLFGGSNIYPAQPQFLSLDPLSASVILAWPIEQSFATPNVADIIEVNATAPGLTIQLSDARTTTTGYTSLFNNIGVNTFTVLDAAGGVIATVASGTVWQIYLADNSTLAGVFRTFQYGAGVSNANAAALAGAGLVAITTTLNETMVVQAKNANYVMVTADRATVIEWTGGTGALTLPAAATVGTDWFAIIKNNGSGVLTVTPPTGTIDQIASLAFQPDESAFVITDGTNWFTVGFGQQINSIFDFIQIDLTAATGNVVLSGAQLNRISYRFTGALAGNVNIVVPNTIQQYWVDNETTGAFSLTVKTAAAAGVVVVQGGRSILYCDGAQVVLANTAGSLTFPDGSAVAPGISFTADQTTGIFRVAPKTLGIATNGVSRGTVETLGHWTLNAADDSTLPTITVNAPVTAAGIVADFVGALTATATKPSVSIRNTNAGGLAALSIAGGNVAVGVGDLAITQDSAFVSRIMNRSAARLVIGTNGIERLNIDNAGQVTVNAPTAGIALNLVGAAGIRALQCQGSLGGQEAAFFSSGTVNTPALSLSNSTNVGATGPVLTANKPGASTAIGRWVAITLDGVLYWIPAWSN